MRTIVSNYQLTLLEQLLHASHFSIAKAMEFKQSAFRSFLLRGWLAYRPGYGFHVTPEGRAAWDRLHHSEIKRHDPTRPLTRYFDYVAHGYEDPRAKKPKTPKTKLRVVRKGAAA